MVFFRGLGIAEHNLVHQKEHLHTDAAVQDGDSYGMQPSRNKVTSHSHPHTVDGVDRDGGQQIPPQGTFGARLA
jgi:hypothetical protein